MKVLLRLCALALTILVLTTACGQSQTQTSTADNATVDGSKLDPVTVASDAVKVTLDGSQVAIPKAVTACADLNRPDPTGQLPKFSMVIWDSEDQSLVRVRLLVGETDVTNVGILTTPDIEYLYDNKSIADTADQTEYGGLGELGDATLTRDGKKVHLEGHVQQMGSGAPTPFTVDATCP